MMAKERKRLIATDSEHPHPQFPSEDFAGEGDTGVLEPGAGFAPLRVKGEAATIPFNAPPRGERDELLEEIEHSLIPIGKKPLGHSPPPEDLARAKQISGDNLNKVAEALGLDQLPPSTRKWKAVAMRLAQLRWPDHFHVRETRWPGRTANRRIEQRNREIVAAVDDHLARQRGQKSVSLAAANVSKLPVAAGLKAKTVENIYSAAKK